MIGWDSALTLQDDVQFGRSAGARSHVELLTEILWWRAAHVGGLRKLVHGDAPGKAPAGDEAGGSAGVAAVKRDSLDEKRRGRRKRVMRQGHCA